MSFIDFTVSNLILSLIISTGLIAFINNDYDNELQYGSKIFITAVNPIICLLALLTPFHLLIIIPLSFNFYGGIVLFILLIQYMIRKINECYENITNTYDKHNHDSDDDSQLVSIPSNENITDYSEVFFKI